MIASNRLQQAQIPQDWHALIHSMSATTGAAIGLLLAVAMGWVG